MFDLIRPIPALAWIPLMTLWFGIGESSKIALIYLRTLMPVLVNTYTGVPMIPQLNIDVALPEKLRGVSKKERYEHAQEFIDLVGLHGFEKYYPHQLSGGMKQRVGIARAYASDCEILLMDEPYRQMDIKTRFYLEDEVIRIWKEYQKTVAFITHNIEEAVYLAERVLILSNKPTKVKEEITISLPHPRNVEDPEFVRIRNYITDQIRWW